MFFKSNLSCMTKAGVSYERSTAIRRQLSTHATGYMETIIDLRRTTGEAESPLTLASRAHLSALEALSNCSMPKGLGQDTLIRSSCGGCESISNYAAWAFSFSVSFSFSTSTSLHLDRLQGAQSLNLANIHQHLSRCISESFWGCSPYNPIAYRIILDRNPSTQNSVPCRQGWNGVNPQPVTTHSGVPWAAEAGGGAT